MPTYRENVNTRSNKIILGPKNSTHHSGKNKNWFCTGVKRRRNMCEKRVKRKTFEPLRDELGANSENYARKNITCTEWSQLT